MTNKKMRSLSYIISLLKINASQIIFKNPRITEKAIPIPLSIFIICINIFSNSVHSNQNTQITPNIYNQHVKVGLITTEPYVIKNKAYYSGLSFDIWKKIATINHFNCEYIDAGINTDLAVQKLENGDFDVLVGGVGIHSSRLKKGEFSLPYFRAEYVLAAKKKYRGFFYNFNLLLNDHSIITIFSIMGSYLLFLSIFWLLEHKYKPEINNKYYKGITELFWLSSLQSKFSTPLFPNKLITKIICFIWQIIISSILFSLFAGISSSFINQYENNRKMFLEPKDVGHKPIALFGSSKVLEVTKNQLNIIKSTSSPQEAINLLDNDEVEGIFLLYGIINSYIQDNNRKDLYISPIKYLEFQLGFLVNRKKAELISPINMALLTISENGEKEKICDLYRNYTRFTNCFWY